MNLRKLAVALAAFTALSGASAFAQDIGVSAPWAGGLGAAPIVAAPACSKTIVNQGLAPLYADRLGTPLYAYPGTTVNQIIQQPAVVETKPGFRPRAGWWRLHWFGGGILLDRHAHNLQTVNSSPAVIECPPAVQPACPAPQVQEQVTKTTTTTTKTTRTLQHCAPIKHHACPRVIKHHCEPRKPVCEPGS